MPKVGAMPVASMPMYDMPEVAAALDDLWAGIARHFRHEGVVETPESIVHGHALQDLWRDPDLWFSQCCGYDLVNGYAGKLQPLAAPHYAAHDCEGIEYASVIIVSEDCWAQDVLDMRGAVCVINGHESHSGMNALRALIAPASQDGRFFSAVKVSGTHAASLELLKNGDADVSAIDCVTHTLFQRYRPASLAGTRKLGTTYRAPGIPYVTRSSIDPDRIARMQAAILRTFADPNLAVTREALLLRGVELVATSEYGRIKEFQDFAVRHGYGELT